MRCGPALNRPIGHQAIKPGQRRDFWRCSEISAIAVPFLWRSTLFELAEPPNVIESIRPCMLCLCQQHSSSPFNNATTTYTHITHHAASPCFHTLGLSRLPRHRQRRAHPCARTRTPLCRNGGLPRYFQACPCRVYRPRLGARAASANQTYVSSDPGCGGVF